LIKNGGAKRQVDHEKNIECVLNALYHTSTPMIDFVDNPTRQSRYHSDSQSYVI
jgi:hypothetical protein